MSEQVERDAFERWYGKPDIMERFGDGQYKNVTVDGYWQCWKARAAMQDFMGAAAGGATSVVSVTEGSAESNQAGAAAPTSLSSREIMSEVRMAEIEVAARAIKKASRELDGTILLNTRCLCYAEAAIAATQEFMGDASAVHHGESQDSSGSAILEASPSPSEIPDNEKLHTVVFNAIGRLCGAVERDSSLGSLLFSQRKKIVETVLEALRPYLRTPAPDVPLTVTRYCVSCGHIGMVVPPAVACCQEARYYEVPLKVASQAQRGFYADIAPVRESGLPDPEGILELFMEAQCAFDHEDDVTHMLKFGEATDLMKYYFHVKVNGPDTDDPFKNDGCCPKCEIPFCDCKSEPIEGGK